MKRKPSASLARDKPVATSAKPMPDAPMDFSDVPRSTDEEQRRARRVGRPKSAHAKQLIAIRVDPRLLARLKRLARRSHKPYQTFIHELLSRAANLRLA